MSAPCPQCAHLRDSPGCKEIQASSGCHACGVVGCWRTKLTCRYYNRDRVKHRDAGLGDTVPHMREVNVVCVADGSAREGRQNINWWLGRQVHFVFQRDLVYFMGSASGDECNCLIDSLRQCLDVICDVARVRSLVQRSNRHLIFGDYMELQHHWRDVIRCIGVVLGMNLAPQDFSIICVDALHVGHGDREGTGTRTLYIARQNANHFVPLFHCPRGVEQIRAEALHIPFGPSGSASSAEAASRRGQEEIAKDADELARAIKLSKELNRREPQSEQEAGPVELDGATEKDSGNRKGPLGTIGDHREPKQNQNTSTYCCLY